MLFYLFVGFGGGFQSFQNHYSNAYMWIFFGMVFGFLASGQFPARDAQRQLAGVPS